MKLLSTVCVCVCVLLTGRQIWLMQSKICGQVLRLVCLGLSRDDIPLMLEDSFGHDVCEQELVYAGAGHSMYNAGIQHELLYATDRMRYLAQRDVGLELSRNGGRRSELARAN